MKDVYLYNRLTEFINQTIDVNSVVTSANEVAEVLSVLSFDYYDQLIVGKENNSILIVNSSGFAFKFSYGKYFLNLVAISTISQETLKQAVKKKLKFQLSKNIFNKDYEIKESITNHQDLLEVTFEFRACTIGEYFDFNEQKCLPCQPGFYSFDKDFLEHSLCKSCTVENFNCYGSFNLTPKRHFWRITEESKNFLRCPSEKGLKKL